MRAKHASAYRNGDWSAELLAEYEERAAVYEFLAGKSHEDANAWAHAEVFKAVHGNQSYYPA